MNYRRRFFRIWAVFLTIATTVCGARSQAVDLTCFPVSAGGSSDPIVRIHVVRNKGEWRIVHFSAKGKSYDRAAQYWILDQSAHGSISWSGSLLNHNDVKITGTVIEKNGASFYKEIVYDVRTRSTPIQNDASCVGPISWADREPLITSNAAAPQPQPQPAASQPQPTVGPHWANDLTAARERMVDCLKQFPPPHDGTESAVDAEVRRYLAACGKDYVALWQQGGSTQEQSMLTAEVEAYQILGCRFANPGEDEIQHTPEGQRMVACSSRASPSLPNSPQSTTAGGTPVEPRAVIYSDDQTPFAEILKAAGEAANLVRANGYRCDSVSAFRPFFWGNGYKLVCNEFRYEYDVEDKGGRWEVTVK
jgi:hypothetical protein